MVLKHTTDNYDGVTVDKTSLPDSIDEFISVMETSLEAWRSVGKKGVWLKVIIRLSWRHQYKTAEYTAIRPCFNEILTHPDWRPNSGQSY